MIRYVLGRLLAAIPILLIVAIFIFSLIHIAPGDPAVLLAGDNANPEQVERIRQRLHLDRSIVVQFGIWFFNALNFDLGNSIYSNRPVVALIAQRIEPTIVLSVLTIIFALMMAIPMGVIAAWKANSWIDRAIMSIAVLGFSVPVFVIGYILVYIFAVELKWFPVQGYKPLADGFLATLRSVTLPAFALALVFSALITRVTRAAMLEILSENYIRTAKAKGLGTSQILIGHALKVAGVPIVTVVGVGFATLIGGVVVTESVFNIPGLGRMTVDAVVVRDYPVVQGIILFFSCLLIVTNLLVDLSYALFDPRIKG